LKTLGTSENMRNPEQSEGSTRQSETKSVDNVHTLFLAHFLLLRWFGHCGLGHRNSMVSLSVTAQEEGQSALSGSVAG
jgi:hypothetical protein